MPSATLRRNPAGFTRGQQQTHHSDPSWVYRRHDVSTPSRALFHASTFTDLLSHLEAMESGRAVAACVGQLAVAEATSFTRSDSLYDGRLTKAHTAVVSCEDAPRFWHSTLTFVMSQDSDATVQGAFAARSEPLLFVVGLITKASPSQKGDVRDTIQKWVEPVDDLLQWDPSQRSCIRFGVDLPLFASYREASLVVSWDASDDRIAPKTLIPPVRARIFTDKAVAGACPHTVIRVFLGAPHGGELQGPTHMLAGRWDCAVTFNQLSTTTDGEHLVVLETLLDPDFAPFLEQLSANVPPFRVVSPTQ